MVRACHAETHSQAKPEARTIPSWGAYWLPRSEWCKSTCGLTMSHSETGGIIFISFAVLFLIPMQFAVLYILWRAFPGAIQSMLQQLPTPKAKRIPSSVSVCGDALLNGLCGRNLAVRGLYTKTPDSAQKLS